MSAVDEKERVAAPPETPYVGQIVELLGGRQTLRANPHNTLEAHEMLTRGLTAAALTHLVGGFAVLSWDTALANAIGMSLRTYQRYVSAGAKQRLNAEQSGRTWKFAEIVAKATDVFGSRKDAEEWLKRPAIGLNRRRPIDLLATPAGVELVESFLDRLDYGVYM